MEAAIMVLGNGRRRRQKSTEPGESPAETPPTRHVIRDIRVSDDGFGLAGRRYAGYHREVTRRHEAGITQDEASVWTDQEGRAYVRGTPRINDAGELELLDGEKPIGTVRNVDGALYFYPVE
jgi:hypothetical protein